MRDEAILSSYSNYTRFEFNGQIIRFRTSSALEKYTQIKEWDNGYLVVNAIYNGKEDEEYIDLIPILENLYIDAEKFLEPIKKVRIEYV